MSDTFELPALSDQAPPLPLNFGHDRERVNAPPQRPPPRTPATVQRLGHVVLQTTTYLETLNWYLEHLGLIVSDFLYYPPGQRARGPIMSFIRCDRGATPTDHHTLAMVLGPANRYVHSAYQVADLDCLAAGGEYLLDRATAGPGASAGTFRAAKSSTTGEILTDSWSSTSATAIFSTAHSTRAGHR